MRRHLILLLLLPLTAWQASAQDLRPVQSLGYRTAVTGSLRNWTPDPNSPLLQIRTRDEQGLIFARDIPRMEHTRYGSAHTGPDPLWQKDYSVQATTGPETREPGQPAARQGFERTAAEIGRDLEGIAASNVTPADPSLAVGPAHIIQMVNGTNGSATFRISDKHTGSLLAEGFMDQLPGTSYNGGGDCLAWYDQLADRFVMSEFGDSSATGNKINSLIIAVSAGKDPMGSWYVYEFSDTSFFPDYPKYGNWHDAWYGSTADFAGSYKGNSIWAINKARMIAGDPVTEVQRVRLTDPDFKYYTLTPVSLIGNTPAGPDSPGMFLYYNDDNWSRNAADVDSIGIITFHPDFKDPARSVVRFGNSLVVAPFRSDMCPGRDCAPSPKGTGYDVIDGRIMNRPGFINFGSHQSIVATHTVDLTGSALAGIRWYELRRRQQSGWTIHQQGSFGPQNEFTCDNEPASFRFMGSAAINPAGQIAIGYNNSSIAKFASISFTGRDRDDPADLMTYQEREAVRGNAYGTFKNRWGDYSELLPDPADDSLFWFTAMYGGSDTRFRTRVLSFRLSPAPLSDASVVNIEYPNNCEALCDRTVQPRVRIRNNGRQPLVTVTVTLKVDGSERLRIPWTGRLETMQEAVVVMPTLTLPDGDIRLEAAVGRPNGESDERTSNDTCSLLLRAGTRAGIPFAEGFEDIAFPPAGWSQSTDGSTNMRWLRVTNASQTGRASAKFDNYVKNEAGTRSDIRTPLLDLRRADSVTLSFMLAAAALNSSISDTLEVRVSTGCGKQSVTVWRKWGSALSTLPGYLNTEFTPAADQWRKETVDLSAFAGRDDVQVSFRNINRSGNNVYLDEVRIEGASFLRRDAAALRIDEPGAILCTTETAPAITFTNLGRDTLRSLQIRYRIDEGSFLSLPWKGTVGRLQPGRAVLPRTAIAPGYRRLEVILSDPNSADDERTSNDTLRSFIGVKSARGLPLTEGFEGTGFPPDQWNDIDPDSDGGWQQTKGAARSGTGAVRMRNYGRKPAGRTDALVSPLLTYAGADSVLLEFALAASPNLTGNGPLPDTLEVIVSTDCGKTFRTVYRKAGEELRTAGNTVSNGVPDEFLPGAAYAWRTERVDLGKTLGPDNTFLLGFRNTGNGDNNIYVDDVVIRARTLPEKLKRNGYLITPNPFTERFDIQLLQGAEDLRSVEIFNTNGQKEYGSPFPSGSRPGTLQIDLSGRPAGVYLVRLTYVGRTVVEQVLKL